MSDEATGEGDRALKVDEAASRLRVSKRTVFRWINSGELESFRAGGARRISTAALAAFSSERTLFASKGARGRSLMPDEIETLRQVLRPVIEAEVRACLAAGIEFAPEHRINQAAKN